MRIIRLAALLAPLLLLPTTVLARSTYAPASLAQYFSLDWKVVQSPRGPAIEGFVYNLRNQTTDRMRLSIEHLDAAGNVVGSTTTWVLGGVPANNRTWFTTHVPAAAGYRVEILSFDWGSRGQ